MANLSANPTVRRREEALIIRERLKQLDAGIDRLVGAVAKAAAFSPAEIEEVGGLLVTGHLRIPVHARLTVRTAIEEVKSKIFGTYDVFTHEADQIHTKLLRPLTVLQALEAGLIARLACGWTWGEHVYERLAANG
jgi:hypothetical protein